MERTGCIVIVIEAKVLKFHSDINREISRNLMEQKREKTLNKKNTHREYSED